MRVHLLWIRFERVEVLFEDNRCAQEKCAVSRVTEYSLLLHQSFHLLLRTTVMADHSCYERQENK